MSIRPRSAFTLRELLVSAAIVAALALILFPVVGRLRVKSVAAPCGANLKQVGEALRFYAQDYDQVWPRGDYCSAAPLTNPNAANPRGCYGPNYSLRVNYYKWPAFIVPYAKSMDAFFCPTRRAAAQASPNWTNNGEIYNSYALNLSITGGKNTGTYVFDPFLGSNALSALKTPGQTFIVIENAVPFVTFLYPKIMGGQGVYDSDGALHETVYPVANREAWQYALYSGAANIINTNITPHNSGLNVAYADGHIGWMDAPTFLSKCPLYADYPYGATLRPSVAQASSLGTFTQGSPPPKINGDWPFWGLTGN